MFLLARSSRLRRGAFFRRLIGRLGYAGGLVNIAANAPHMILNPHEHIHAYYSAAPYEERIPVQ
jgi:hypothetical protein